MSGRPARKKRKVSDGSGGNEFSIDNFRDTEAGVDKEAKDDFDLDLDEEEDDFVTSGNQRERVDQESRQFYNRLLHESKGSRQDDLIKRIEEKYVHNNREEVTGLDLDTDETFNVDGTLEGRENESSKRINNNFRKKRRIMSSMSIEERRIKLNIQKKAHLLPSISDPKLFMIKVKSGKEKEICLHLMQKFFDYQQSKKTSDLLFLSCFALDHLSGFIYVEAMNKKHVERLLNQVDNVFRTKNWLKIVPLKQMVEVIEFKPKGVKVKRGQYVRITRGIFKGDLAYVFGVNEAKGEGIVKLIPRLGKKVGIGRTARPEKKLFNQNDHQTHDISFKYYPQFGIRFLIHEGKMYHEGFLYKLVSFKSISIKNVNPTLDELQLFKVENLRSLTSGGSGGSSTNRGGRGGSGSIPYLNKIEGNKNGGFKKGENLIVISGPNKGIIGELSKILGSESNIIDIICKKTINNNGIGVNGIRGKEYRNKIDDVRKYFEIGDYIKVISGEHEGESGSIIEAYNEINMNNMNNDDEEMRKELKKWDIIHIFSETKIKEFKVLRNECIKTSPLATSKSYGGYSLHDYVRIAVTSRRITNGVIVGVSNKEFEIINTSGIVSKYKIEQLRGKKQILFISNSDIKGRKINQNDNISIIKGPYEGITGIVKYGEGEYLYVHSKEIINNSGIIIIKEKECRTTGGSFQKGTINSFIGGQAGGRLIKIRKRRHPLLNKNVKILKGKYKGYYGVVKSITGEKGRIELHAKFKIISVPLHSLKQIERNNNRYNSSNNSLNGRNQSRDDIYSSIYSSNNAPNTYRGIDTPLIRPTTPHTTRIEIETPGGNNLGGNENISSSFIPITPKVETNNNIINDNNNNNDNNIDNRDIKIKEKRRNDLDSSNIRSSFNPITPGANSNNINSSGGISNKFNITTPHIHSSDGPRSSRSINLPITPGIPLNNPITPGANIRSTLLPHTPGISMNLPHTPGVNLQPHTPGINLGSGNIVSSGMINTPIGISTPGVGVGIGGRIGGRNNLTTTKIPITPGLNNINSSNKLNSSFPHTPGLNNINSSNISNLDHHHSSLNQSLNQTNQLWIKIGMFLHCISKKIDGKVIKIQDLQNITIQTSSNDTIITSQSDLSVIQPEKNDRVMVIKGPNKGKIGMVFGIDDDECIVRVSDVSYPLMIKDTHLTKFVG